MRSIINKFVTGKKNKLEVNSGFSKLQNSQEIMKLFNCFSNFSDESEIRFVGGCIRKILNKEQIDDIDLATNLTPQEIKIALDKFNLKYFETGIKHGTISSIINEKKFEITSLRKDISTDGRHAKVEFTKDWLIDASRRDFTINSIYADLDGNLFDPFEGKFDLENGQIKFIGNPEIRIQEDYLRIMRYIRFFLNYSEIPHDENIKKIILKNINGIKNLSKNRILDELKKLFLSSKFLSIGTDNFLLDILKLVVPELKNFHLLKNLDEEKIDLIKTKDFNFLLSVLIIDESDNSDYFLYKYNLSKKESNRISFLKKNFNNIKENNFFKYKNFSKLHYLHDIKLINDLIDLKIIYSKKYIQKFINLKNEINKRAKPEFPIKANYLIEKFNFKEGKNLGDKLKELENIWINNDFEINEEQIKKSIAN